jgi:AATGal transferase
MQPDSKRVCDILGAGIGFLAVSPLLVGVAFCLRIIDGSPVFFRQQRVGRFGNTFRLTKFRTMSRSNLAQKGRFDAGDRARITPLGKILRKAKLDELPQLWNVLKGDMSLVGPRPEVPEWVAVYPARWKTVLQVRPGITDNASIQFRNEEDLLAQAENPRKLYREVILPKKLDLYEQYVREHSVKEDLRIILKTLKSLF